MERIAYPPETLEGWYVLHQLFSLDRAALAADQGSVRTGADALRRIAAPDGGGWSTAARLIGSSADLLVIHFRPTLEGIGEAERWYHASPLERSIHPEYSFLSVTEAGLYHITAEAAREAEERGGKVGDEQYQARIAERARAERESDHVRKRLYPSLPPGMPYVCFYPMDKRREPGQNWYTLTLDERSRLMQAHGMTGRRYSGRVLQIISGAIGLDEWEWGVTLFSRDPLEFKKLVTDMRFDEVTARYAEFGRFYVGKITSPEEALI